MIKYYTNRELSRFLIINLAKWKRWSREFLPPDPLGGMQSGYARQYSIDKAFTVFLGGYLVSDLKYSIPESKRILNDLEKWFKGTGFYLSTDKKDEYQIKEKIKEYRILIEQNRNTNGNDPKFNYRIQGLLERKRVNNYGSYGWNEKYIETMILNEKNKSNDELSHTRLLEITKILEFFIKRVGLKKSIYRMFSGDT